MADRYCRNCGAALQADDRYCSECGQQADPTGESVDGTAGQQDWEFGDSRQAAAVGGSARPNTGMAALTHVLALFTWLIGPLVVYLVTDDPFVERNAANAINWQIMFALYLMISFVLVFVLVGFLFILVLPIVDLAFIIIAALKASNGEAWTYPLTPELL